MEKSNYFNTLLQLYEDVDQKEIDQQQQKIADSGSDVEDPNVLPKAEPEDQQQSQEETDQDNLEDTNYLAQKDQGQALTNQSSNSSGKLVKLFELMQNLLTYSETFNSTLDSVELGLLDNAKLDKANSYKSALDSLKTKIHDYLIDNFEYAGYEENIYAYVLFRTELLTIVKNLRDTLGLNDVDDKDDTKKQK